MTSVKNEGYRLRIDRSVKQKMDSSSGVSEVIGAILLVSIVALLVAVIGVYLFSQPVPQKIPNLNFMTGVDSTRSTLYLYHNGGDTLTKGEFKVLLDGVEASYVVADDTWSLGKNLVVDITNKPMPKSVQLVYNNTASSGGPGSTGAVLLDEATVNVVSSGTVLPDQIPYLDCSAVRNWDCADQIPFDIVVAMYRVDVRNQRTNFMKHDVGNAVRGVTGGVSPHFNFTVSKGNSSIIIAPANICSSGTVYPLNATDKVSLMFTLAGGPDDFILYGSAPEIWEMAVGDGGDITVTVSTADGRPKSGFPTGGRRLCHTYITEYSDIDSTLIVESVGDGSKVTNLVVNNTVYINGVNSTDISFINFKPTPSGLFMIEYSGLGSPVFFIGWQDQIQFGGVPVSGLGL
jgi:FlaG/FlaF family flagellin (archaellin)